VLLGFLIFFAFFDFFFYSVRLKRRIPTKNHEDVWKLVSDTFFFLSIPFSPPFFSSILPRLFRNVLSPYFTYNSCISLGLMPVLRTKLFLSFYIFLLSLYFPFCDSGVFRFFFPSHFMLLGTVGFGRLGFGIGWWGMDWLVGDGREIFFIIFIAL